jgi:hypothetical protein
MPRCKITGEPSLGDALRAILADPALAARIEKIQVRLGAHDVFISAVSGGLTRFASAEALREFAKEEAAGKVQTYSTISGVGLASIARLISGR